MYPRQGDAPGAAAPKDFGPGETISEELAVVRQRGNALAENYVLRLVG